MGLIEWLEWILSARISQINLMAFTINKPVSPTSYCQTWKYLLLTSKIQEKISYFIYQSFKIQGINEKNPEKSQNTKNNKASAYRPKHKPVQNWIIKLKKIYLKTSREFWCRIWKNRKKFLRINKISCEMLKDFLHMQQKINQTVTNSRTVTPLNETVTHMSQSFFFYERKFHPLLFCILNCGEMWRELSFFFLMRRWWFENFSIVSKETRPNESAKRAKVLEILFHKNSRLKAQDLKAQHRHKPPLPFILQ